MSQQTFEQFSQQLSRVDEAVGKIRAKIVQLNEVGKRVAESVGETEINDLQGRLDRLVIETNALGAEASNSLKELQAEIMKMPPDADQAMRKNLHASQTKKFLDVLKDYQMAQRNNRDNCRNRFARQYRIVNPNATDEDINQKLQEGGGALFTEQSLDSSNLRTKQALAQAEKRARDVERINKNILQINQLFQDMERLVKQQGETIDRIYVNTYTTQVQVEKGTGELVESVKIAQDTLKKRRLIFGILASIVIIVIIALIIYFTSLSKKN